MGLASPRHWRRHNRRRSRASRLKWTPQSSRQSKLWISSSSCVQPVVVLATSSAQTSQPARKTFISRTWQQLTNRTHLLAQCKTATYLQICRTLSSEQVNSSSLLNTLPRSTPTASRLWASVPWTPTKKGSKLRWLPMSFCHWGCSTRPSPSSTRKIDRGLFIITKLAQVSLSSSIQWARTTVITTQTSCETTSRWLTKWIRWFNQRTRSNLSEITRWKSC